MTELVDPTDQDGMIGQMTTDIVDQKHLAEQLLEQAKEQNIELVGPGGLLNELTKNVLETALDAEMAEHLGYEKHDRAGHNSGSSRNGTRAALPAAARSRAPRVLRPSREAPPPRHVAMGSRAPRRIPETQNASSRHWLRTATNPTATQQTTRPPGRHHRCPETGRAHALLPQQRITNNATQPDHRSTSDQPTKTATRSHPHALIARSGLTSRCMS